MNKSLLLLGFSTIVFSSCTIFKNKDKSSTDSTHLPTEDVVKNTEESQPKVQPIYNASETRTHDLIHTELRVNFNWEKRTMDGVATLTLHPYFYETDSLILDAKAMDIRKVTMASGLYKDRELPYKNDGWYLRIKLPKKFKRQEEFKIVINYTANPEKVTTEGASAISEAKGLYFINHDGSNPNKHMEIWTQGETEASSCWFPTIDSPNEKTTQEMYITVEDKYKTLSNGRFIGSEKAENGKRTDHWKMEQPHAPYLFMMAVGEFKIVKDTWTKKSGEEIEVNYYVEEKYEQYARDIFGKTPKMLQFFSDKLGVEYPWPKYSQVVVRDYVSGAMENTSATIHGDFLYRTKRELIDADNESIIAHELFHHWFGDYVTCESWANLPLNESFANYSQYLWDEYEHGKMEADKHAYSEMEGYFISAQQGGHVDMIRYDYGNMMEMFDGHSYNKGGRILNMLRTYLGDEAFFESLKNYLNDNKYTSTEIHELRMQFENVCGQDLNWFFNQWFLASGHPEVSITQDYDTVSKTLTVNINQTQDTEKWPLYQLPIDIDIYVNGKVQRKRVWVKNELNEFVFDHISALPDLVNIDATKTTLWKKKEQKPLSQWVYQLNHAPLWQDKKEAFSKLKKSKGESAMNAIINMLDHEFYDVRLMAIASLKRAKSNQPDLVKTKVTHLFNTDKSAKVRASALKFISKNHENAPNTATLLEKGLEDDSYKVMGTALKGIAKTKEEEGLTIARKYANEESADINLIVGEIFSKYGEESDFAFFEKALPELSMMNKYGLMNSLYGFLTHQSDAFASKGIKIYEDEILSDGMWITKLAGYQLLNGLKEHYGKRVNEIETKILSLEGLAQQPQLEKDLNYCKSKEAEISKKLKTLKENETDSNVLKYLK